MSYREILVYTGAGELARSMCDYAAKLASILKVRLAGLIVESDVIDLRALDSAILDKERQEAFNLLSKRRADLHDAAVRAGTVFQNAAKQRGVPCDTFFKTCMPAEVPDMVTDLARLYDCSILPAAVEFDGLEIPLVEEVLFGSGRPLILVPRELSLPESVDVIVVAWDGTRPATRAVHDAIPILRQATNVHIVTITDEKPLDKLPSGHDLVRHLNAHDIAARYEEIRFEGRPIGEQIMREALRFNASLLVMGAYGHSRIRQIVFGGTTRTVLKAPALPVFMAN